METEATTGTIPKAVGSDVESNHISIGTASSSDAVWSSNSAGQIYEKGTTCGNSAPASGVLS